MKPCPFCAEPIQEDAIKCRFCGEWLDSSAHGLRSAAILNIPFWGYEYKSKAELFGFPLVHIVQGYDSKTGRPRIAKGIIAIGNLAFGVIAIGGISLGVFTFGGLSFGLLALGGIALGCISFGGIAIGLVGAVGGMALSLFYAIGGLALAPHAIGAMGTDPEFLRILKKLILFDS